ncbi:MAG: MBL fold metallo-hydrolase [Bacillota bacterium]
MIEEVLPGIFRVEVPLFNNPLQSVNSYIIKGRDRNLVVDTGMDREECAKALFAAFTELGIDMGETDFFITHLHVDHLELVFKIASGTSRVYFNNPDREILDDEGSWEEAIRCAAQNGFPTIELRKTLKIYANSIFKFINDVKFTILKEGDKINTGNHEFKCLETPGHTPGSMCLYEDRENFLFSGDHILQEVTPNISLLLERELNPLQSYLESLDKIAALNVDLILPGHRKAFRNPQQRIKEIKSHHRFREEEILAILNENAGDAYQTASRMGWDLPLAWQEFPVFQRWFATGEALAHLKYLESRNLVSRYEKGGKTIFTLT